MFCLFSGVTYLSLGISLSGSMFSVLFLSTCDLLCDEVFETFRTLSAIFLPIKSPVASGAFWIALFETVLSALIADYLAWLVSLWLYLLLKFLLIFLPMLLLIFVGKDKNPCLFTNIQSLGRTR